MVNPGALIGLGSLLLTISEKRKRERLQRQMENENEPDPSPEELPAEMRDRREMADSQERTAEAVEKLVQAEYQQKPSPSDKDAFSTATIDLSDGETATVTVEPVDGFNLRVKRIEFDRRSDHDYEFNVGGSVSSVSHRTIYTKPKLVAQSDRVVATVTNNSGSSTTLDFELEAWAERPGVN